MKNHSLEYFYEKIHKRRVIFPSYAQVELTYRCNLNCIHCYCKGLEGREEELTTNEFKKILDKIHREGCLWLTLTGGEPLIRDDFLEIYAYAKKKGFIISIFTNGHLFNKKIIDFLTKVPPFSIEITLNGVTENTYEKITQIKGSLPKVMENIKILAMHRLPIVIKTNLLKQNKDELAKIKNWTEHILGKPLNKYYFKCDPFIYPRLNKDTAPCKYRLSFNELMDILKQDDNIWQQYEEYLHKDFEESLRHNDYLYHCNAYMSQFFINPYGKLKFCLFTDKFSGNLREKKFKEIFYNRISDIFEEKFKTNSKCKTCNLRPICCWCPARAYLETGDQEKPVEYYCQLTGAIAKETERLQKISRR